MLVGINYILREELKAAFMLPFSLQPVGQLLAYLPMKLGY